MPVGALVDLHDQGRMTWTEREHGWVAVPDEVLEALARGGFQECKREMTTSRRDLRPAGGVWQGVNRTTGSVASAIWVARATQCQALVFVEIDGELINVNHGAARRPDDASYRDEGGES
ncbi:MAG: hypothetical protein E6K82_08835 [Candidatus Rokuibacteriota bacterium]|nr:MAG: hypothetical protein E6K82_08835 [Candidatus Rokubacteria bacterium]